MSGASAARIAATHASLNAAKTLQPKFPRNVSGASSPPYAAGARNAPQRAWPGVVGRTSAVVCASARSAGSAMPTCV